MAIAYRASTSGTYNSTSGTATIPAGAQIGDLLVLVNVRSANDTAPVTPSGWTRVVDPTTASSLTLAVYTRICQSGDPGASVTLQWAATGRVSFGIVAYSGVDGTSPLDVAAQVAAYLTASASTSHTTPTSTAATDGSMSVDVVVSKSSTAETSFTPPAGVTEDLEYLIGSASSPSFAVGHEDTPVAASGSGGGNTWTTVQSSQYIVATLMLRTAVTVESRTADFSLSLALAATSSGATPARTADFALTLTPSASSLGSVASLTHAWAGGQTSSSFVVASRLAAATSVRLAVSTSPDMSSPTWIGAQSPDGSGRVRHVVTGLPADTRHYYRLADTPSGGTETMVGSVGTVKTLQAAGTPFAGSRKVLIGACLRTSSTDPAGINSAAAWAADWGHFNGDFFYSGSTSTTVATQAAQWDNQLANVTGLKEFIAGGHASFYNTSDHEAGPDNGDSNNAYTAANITAYKQLVPYGTLLDPAGTTTARDQKWTDGRVSFYMIDCRTTDRSAGAATDDASKTMLGAAQLARLLDWLANDPQPFKVIISDVQWMGPTSAAATKPDAWWSYSTERQTIINAIAAQAAHVELWHGDSHLVGYATAAKNSTYGGIPVLAAAGYDQDGGGQQTSTFSAYWNNSSGDVNIYGRVTFTDDGTTITRTFSGWDAEADVERVANTVTVDTTPARAAEFALTLSATATALEREVSSAPFTMTLATAAVSVEREQAVAPFTMTLGGSAAVVERESTTAAFTLTLALAADGEASGGTPARTAAFTLTLGATAAAVPNGGSVATAAAFMLALGGVAAVAVRESRTATFTMTLAVTATVDGQARNITVLSVAAIAQRPVAVTERRRLVTIREAP